ncbi:E3 ubiquitin-protein ligase RNF220-like [Frankliniella occidentalis]|uniref:E3 ubiquitin-protein ligase RNF220-like n=1 Tax=Frankliniella occidentalis TaxID=133901 RepID=A0A9C6XA99_FRAOC|nr:E3 ubiquitin-protein ligase RNF220-like [Frankliniella occidentalis]
MENSAYAPNPLPPPALVVFSQAGGLPEALRMQRPFNPQTPEVKDLHIPFSASSFGLRHMDGYPGLPAHLLHHLQPQFLHPALDPRLPFGSGAFRPLGSSPVHESKGFASAFAPPSKCLKIETSNGTHETTLFSPGAAAEDRPYMNGQPQQRSDSSSPASVSVSPPNLQQVVKEESSDTPMSEDRDGTATPGSEGTERSTPEEGRGFRSEYIRLWPRCRGLLCVVSPGGVSHRGGQGPGGASVSTQRQVPPDVLLPFGSQAPAARAARRPSV